MHIPMRMCIACRKMQPQNELIRIVHEINTGNIMFDNNKKLFGRGAYICKNAECIKRAEKRNGLARHFKCAVPDEIYREAQEQILTGMKKG